MHWLIATDLDGTLLDDGYPLEAAAAAIDALFELAPVADGRATLQAVLATSKTLAECMRLVDRCASHPIIAFENGAGLAWPTAACTRRGKSRRNGYEIESAAMDYGRIRAHLLELRAKPAYRFRGFGDMPAAEIAARTGLDEDSAAAARQRMASEPLVWQGAPAVLPSFARDLNELGLKLAPGGRFHHATGSRDKAGAVAAIRKHYVRGRHDSVVTLACGDAPNDAEMMLAADYALVFPGRNGGYALSANAAVFHAPNAGPAAWLERVSHIVESKSPRIECK